MFKFITKSGREALAKRVVRTTHVEMGLEGHENGLISCIEESLLCEDILTGREFFAPVWGILTEEEAEALPVEEEEQVNYN